MKGLWSSDNNRGIDKEVVKNGEQRQDFNASATGADGNQVCRWLRLSRWAGIGRLQGATPTPAKPTMRGDNRRRVEEGAKNRNQTRKSNNSKQKKKHFIYCPRDGKMWKLSPHRDVWRALLIKSASREKHVLFMTPLHPPTHLPPCYHLVGQMLKMTKSSCRQQHIIQVIKWSYAIWSFSFSFFFFSKGQLRVCHFLYKSCAPL